MTKQDIQVKKDSEIKIKRGKHDKEHPYVMISTAMLKDKSLSPRTKGIFCYLLSLPSNWETHPKQVAEALDVGKDQVYSALKELIQEGYATRHQEKKENFKFDSVTYEFFEEKQEFKKSLPRPGFPDPGIPTLLNIDNTKKEEETPLSSFSEKPKQLPEKKDPPDPVPPDKPPCCQALPEQPKKRKSAEFSPKVRDFTENMINMMILHEPLYQNPSNLAPIMAQVDLMIHKECLGTDLMIKVLLWALNDGFWKGSLYCKNPAKFFRDKFLTLKAKMEGVHTEKKVDRRTKNKDGTPVKNDYLDNLF